MLKILLSFSVLLLIGCGGNGDHNTASNSQNLGTKSVHGQSKLPKGVLAKDALLHDSVQKLNGRKVRIKTNVVLGEDDTSKDFVAVYGKINGQEITSYLNHHYLDKSAKISVEVYDDAGNLLVASEPIVLNKDLVDFGELKTK